MTVLDNSIHISASPHEVWAVLAALDQLAKYDPGVVKSEVISPSRSGPGSARRCDLLPGGWFKEKVSEWKPGEAIAFELFECSLPVRRLQHRYTLTPEGDGTRVSQHMQYQLKFGPVGRLMDALLVRKKWDAGIKSFFAGLKRYVEAQQPAGTGASLRGPA